MYGSCSLFVASRHTTKVRSLAGFALVHFFGKISALYKQKHDEDENPRIDLACRVEYIVDGHEQEPIKVDVTIILFTLEWRLWSRSWLNDSQSQRKCIFMFLSFFFARFVYSLFMSRRTKLK